MQNISTPALELTEQSVPLPDLGGSMAALRLSDEAAIKRMRESLLQQGQLTSIAVFRKGEVLEVIDGFKRLRSAQQLGWPTIRVRALEVSSSAAKAALMILNQGHGVTVLEEAWVVRALYREDHLSQPQIARLFSRDKSWVSRRLLMAEQLEEKVAADVRLGLVGASAAEIIARVPRGNQRALTDLVIKQGLTSHQLHRLTTDLMAHTPLEQAAMIEQAAQIPWLASRRGPQQKRSGHSLAEWIAIDAAGITRGCVRLGVHLQRQPLGSLGTPASDLSAQTLQRLADVLSALKATITSVLNREERGNGNSANA